MIETVFPANPSEAPNQVRNRGPVGKMADLRGKNPDLFHVFFKEFENWGVNLKTIELKPVVRAVDQRKLEKE